MIVKRNKKGRGVYATKPHKKGDIVEKSHAIFVPEDEVPDQTIAAHYVFCWETGTYAIALSNASLFNHSSKPNLKWERDKKHNQLIFRAAKNIKIGDEYTIDYGYDIFLEPEKAKFARGDV